MGNPNNRYNKLQNIVKPELQTPIVRRMTPGEINNVSHVIDVAPSAQHMVEMKTSAVDRSKGFLLATLPLLVAFGIGMVFIAVLLFDVPLASFAALAIFWLAFLGAWLAAYVYTLAVSAEGIARYEAKQKWDVVKREQAERWRYQRGE